MTVSIYANGTGGTLGDELVTETELYTTGAVYYVHHTGSNTNGGTSRQKPFATLVFAFTVAVDCDIIVMLDGHTETIDAQQILSQNGMKVVAEGTSEGVPTVVLTSSLSVTSMLKLTGTNIALANIKFASGTLTGVPRVEIAGDFSMVRGCYFESGATDAWWPLSWNVNVVGCRLYNTTFISVSTTDAPSGGLVSNRNENCEIEACTFDGGTTGFSVAGIFDASALGGSGPQNFRAQQLRLLNGAGIAFGADVTGYVGLSEKSGGPTITGFGRHLARGFAQLGDPLLSDTELYMSGTPFYVHYGTGDDGNSGIDELAPKKTIASALSVISDDCSIIVLLPSHVEPLTVPLGATPVPGTTIIGCGSSGGKPSCRLYNSDNANHLAVMVLPGSLRNIWFDKTTSESPTSSLVDMISDYTEIRGCLVTPGTDEIGVSASSSFQTFRETKFESYGTAVASRPSRGLSMSSEGSMTDEDVRGCEFSNLTNGFSSFAFKEDESILRLYVIGMTLSYGADLDINDTTTGLVNPETSTGSASVEWG